MLRLVVISFRRGLFFAAEIPGSLSYFGIDPAANSRKKLLHVAGSFACYNSFLNIGTNFAC